MKKYLQLITLVFAVCLITSASRVSSQTVSDFSGIQLQPSSWWNGSDNSGGFRSGNIFFPNYYADWGGGVYSFNGFAVSNMSDTETPGLDNQYSAFTGEGYNGNENYSVVYVSDPVTYQSSFFVQLLEEANGGNLQEIVVTNSTYAALAMRDGDGVSKKFGGDTGNDPDWFMLEIIAWHNGQAGMEDKVEFYLADYRFEDNTQNYILNTWEIISLEDLGRADSLEFRLSSSDMGEWGMNTPAYFCIGQITTMDDGQGTNVASIDGLPHIEVYPNPFTSHISISSNHDKQLHLQIFDVTGRQVFSNQISGSQFIDLSFLPKGYYIAQIQHGTHSTTRKILRH